MAEKVQVQFSHGFPRGVRCLAFSIDLIAVTGLAKLGAYLSGFLLVFVSALKGQSSDLSQSQIFAAIQMGNFFWFFTAAYFNYGLLQGMTGSSLGKHFCGLIVVDQDLQPVGLTHSWVRTLSYLVSLAPLGLGFLVALFDGKMRTIHDRFNGTLVLEREVYEQLVASWTDKPTLLLEGESVIELPDRSQEIDRQKIA